MKDKIYVWDPLIRIFHWLLVLAFVVSYLSGDDYETVHVYSGYLILLVLLLRIVWGLVGSKRARFADFIYSPSEAITYLKGLFSGEAKKYTGHNPAGAWMTIMLLLSLILIGLSGLKLYGVEGHGPLAIDKITLSDESAPVFSENKYREIREQWEDDQAHRSGDKYRYEKHEQYEENEEHEDEEEFWEDVHEFFVNLTLFLIILHLAGVLLSSLKQRENLVISMFSGYKKR